MNKQEEGIVVAVAGDIAKVKASRHGDCKNCGACPGDSSMILDVKNPKGAKPGQHVIFEVQEVNMLKAAFIVYILPLIAAFLGSIAGSTLGNFYGHSKQLYSIIGGVVFFAISIIYIKFYDKTSNETQAFPSITKVFE